MHEITMAAIGHTAFQMVLFAVLGLGLEVIFTGIFDCRRGTLCHLMGYSSLWYLPLYMLVPVFFAFGSSLVFQFNWFMRGIIYMLAIFAIEYVAMFLLRLLLGASPSEKSYYQSPFNIKGLIRLDFAPVMFALGLFLECVYRNLT